jgi:hypothetical protein
VFNMLNIRLVDPAEDPSVIDEFYAGQTRAYAEFAAEKAATNVHLRELEQGCVYFVIAQDEHTGELAGGLRMYLRRGGAKLPVERVLADNHRLIELLGRQSRRGITEISGFWAQSCWRGTGLPSALVRTAVAAMPMPTLNVQQGIAFSHHHIIYSRLAPLGWVADASVGNIAYPDARYQSSVIWIDPLTLLNAQPEQRSLIFQLRASMRRGEAIRWSLAGGHVESMLSEARP